LLQYHTTNQLFRQPAPLHTLFHRSHCFIAPFINLIKFDFPHEWERDKFTGSSKRGEPNAENLRAAGIDETSHPADIFSLYLPNTPADNMAHAHLKQEKKFLLLTLSCVTFTSPGLHPHQHHPNLHPSAQARIPQMETSVFSLNKKNKKNGVHLQHAFSAIV
jgi:hypothetical protein